MSTPLSAFVLTLMLLLFVTRFFPRMNLLDFPQRYNLKRARLPYPAGSAAVLSFLLIFPLLQGFSMRALSVMGAVCLLGIACFIDDRKTLPAILRLIIQAACAVIIFIAGDCTGGQICSVTNPLESFIGGSTIDLHGVSIFLSLIVTVFWLMLTTNALNWFDGIPGQVTTLSTIGYATIGFLSLSDRVNQPAIAMIAFVLAAISLACLLFDFPPPRVVIGDTGSMFFGFLLGILTVYAGGKVATAFLVLGVPIIDLLFVITKRVTEGRSPFKGSMSGEHLHHRLLAKGWSPRQIILLTASIGAAFGCIALFLSTTGKFAAALVLFCIMFALWRTSAIRKQ